MKDYTDFDFGACQQRIVDAYNLTEGHKNDADGYNCPICKNKEFLAVLDDGGDIVNKYCDCHSIREALRRARNSGLDDVLKDYTFEKFVDTEAWQKENKRKAICFCEDKNATLFFIGGQPGCGKTHLCSAICGYYIKAGYDVVYMRWVDDSKKLKAQINDFNAYQSEIEKFKKVCVLYLDDFFKTRRGEEPTNGDINLAFEILNSRLNSKDKITIISSEKTFEELLNYDEALMSRIYQKAGNYKIIVGRNIEKNYRLKEERTDFY